MTTKEKLDMLWKYLALAVVAAGLILFSNMHLEDDDEHIFIGVKEADVWSPSFTPIKMCSSSSSKCILLKRINPAATTARARYFQSISSFSFVVIVFFPIESI
jgi:hypothetical protein